MAHVLPVQIAEADVVAGGPGRARQRALHEAYIEQLRLEIEEGSDKDEDDREGEEEDDGEDPS